MTCGIAPEPGWIGNMIFRQVQDTPDGKIWLKYILKD